jgi:predicted acyltransferase
MPAHPRLVSLDAFRGLTIAGMILVNYAGSFPHMYVPLTHAPWHGFTPTDLVFPSFLFIVGVAMWFSFKPYEQRLTRPLALKILRRTALIFLIGLALHALPFWTDYSKLRILGVLQRIALCYGLASFLCLTLSRLALGGVSVALLLGYWLLLLLGGGADPFALATNLERQIDLAVLGPKHLYGGPYGMPFDPEGLLSTLPAVVNVIAGYLTGRLIDAAADKRKAVVAMLGYGAALIVAGRVWNIWFPINKPIWTSSYVLYTVGLALVLLAFFLWLIDVQKKPGWAAPFVVYGMNPLFIYVLASLWESALWRIQTGKDQPLMFWLQEKAFAPFLGAVNGGLALALAHVVLFWAVAWALNRRRIYVKI